MRIRPVANARDYEEHFKPADASDWQPGKLHNSARGLVVHGLTAGVLYTFQVRAIGGSTGQSEWSDAVSHRSL